MNRPLESIRSTANPRVRDWVRLHSGRRRKDAGRFLIDGAYETREALQAGVPIEEVLLCGDYPEQLDEWMAITGDAGVAVRMVSESVMRKVSVRKSPDGVIALGKRRERKLALPEKWDGPLVVASRLEKPGNLGALVRTACAAGAAGVILCDPAVDFEHPQVIRASRGAVFRLQGWIASATETMAFLQRNKIPSFAADKDACVDFWQVQWPDRFALILGEEHGGLPEAWRSGEVRGVSIPMCEGVDSLNVSVSGALLLYEWRRQQR